MGTFDTADAYYAFAVVGLIILQLVNSTLQTPPAGLRQELVAGTYERLLLSPMGPVAGTVAGLVFPLLLALITGVVMLAFASLLFGVDVRWETVPLAVPVGFLAAASFAPFGLLLMAAVVVVKQAVGGATWIVAAISLLAGLYFPVALLPDWIQWASEVQPFTPAVELLRNLLVGTPLKNTAWEDVLRLIGFFVILMPPAVWILGRAIATGRKRGTIIEY